MKFETLLFCMIPFIAIVAEFLMFGKPGLILHPWKCLCLGICVSQISSTRKRKLLVCLCGDKGREKFRWIVELVRVEKVVRTELADWDFDL